MALNWAFTDKERWNALPDTEASNSKNDVLIWATMTIGLCEITKKNIDEWRFRAKALATVGREIAQFTRDGKTENYIPSREDLEARIGLSTNADSLTRKQFMARVAKIIEKDVNEYFVYENKKELQDVAMSDIASVADGGR